MKSISDDTTTQARGERLLDFIQDEVYQRLNPNDEECWHCDGEGCTFDCIDGCCADADYGCELCSRDCVECKIFAGQRARAARLEVIKSGDLDLVRAWLKSIGRWKDDLTDEHIRAELAKAQESTGATR